jgi:hypothetical protein
VTALPFWKKVLAPILLCLVPLGALFVLFDLALATWQTVVHRDRFALFAWHVVWGD